jgi:hypothetical protein
LVALRGGDDVGAIGSRIASLEPGLLGFGECVAEREIVGSEGRVRDPGRQRRDRPI